MSARPLDEASPPAESSGASAGFADELKPLFATRLQGPPEARAAVLEALAACAPYPLAGIALQAGPALGLATSFSRRLGVLAEVVRAALTVCQAAVRQKPLPGRAERAMRVLVADTLLTFAFELAADLPDPGGAAVRRRLGAALGTEGSLGWLAGVAAGASSATVDVDRILIESEADRAASSFLGGALLELASGGAGETELDPAMALEIRLTASLQERGRVGVLAPTGTLPPRLRDALAAWRSFAAAHGRTACGGA